MNWHIQGARAISKSQPNAKSSLFYYPADTTGQQRRMRTQAVRLSSSWRAAEWPGACPNKSKGSTRAQLSQGCAFMISELLISVSLQGGGSSMSVSVSYLYIGIILLKKGREWTKLGIINGLSPLVFLAYTAARSHKWIYDPPYNCSAFNSFPPAINITDYDTGRYITKHMSYNICLTQYLLGPLFIAI